MTSEQCLLNRNRNPNLSRAEIEGWVKDSLGVTQIVWLAEGIVGDDTDGHIDDIARFTDAKTVLCVLESDPSDANYRCLRENYERLQRSCDQDGAKFDLVTLPCPQPVYCEGTRLPASYANFYIANEVVLVPIFDDPSDKAALGILQDCFRDRKIIGLRCNELVAGLGAIHCVTQQQPAVAPR